MVKVRDLVSRQKHGMEQRTEIESSRGQVVGMLKSKLRKRESKNPLQSSFYGALGKIQLHSDI